MLKTWIFNSGGLFKRSYFLGISARGDLGEWRIDIRNLRSGFESGSLVKIR